MSETTTPEPSTPEPGEPACPGAEPESDAAASDDAASRVAARLGRRGRAAPAPTTPQLLARLEQEGEVAADYLEGLLDIADLDGDIDMDVEGERAAVSIVGADLSDLVGPDGQVLEALQELTRLAVAARTGERSRLMLDISGHRARRREQLREQAAAGRRAGPRAAARSSGSRR